MHQRLDVERKLFLGIGRNSLVLENLGTPPNQPIDYICVEEDSAREILERIAGTVLAV
jgi:hypothetical protein